MFFDDTTFTVAYITLVLATICYIAPVLWSIKTGTVKGSLFMAGILLFIISGMTFYQAGIEDARKEALNFPLEDTLEVYVDSDFSTQLLRLQESDFELALTQTLEAYAVKNPFIRYYRGYIAWESPLKASNGSIRTSLIDAIWEIKSTTTGDMYYLNCEVGVSDALTSQWR